MSIDTGRHPGSDRAVERARTSVFDAPLHHHRSVRPGTAPGGMIPEVPGAVRRPPSPVDAPSVEPPSVEAPSGFSPPTGVPVAKDFSDHTVLRWREDAVDAREAPGAPGAIGPTPVLEAPDGRRVELVGTVAIGRDPSPQQIGDVVLMTFDDLTISKTHASVQVVEDRLVVTDLHSSNGTWIEIGDGTLDCVSGLPVDIPLAPCTLRLGSVRFEVRVPS